MSGQACDAPRHRWEILGLRWEYECRAARRRRWGVSDGSRGVSGSHNPLSAYMALRRWRKVPARPAPTHESGGER